MSVLAIDSSARGRVVVVRATVEGVLVDGSVVESPATLPALHDGFARLLEDDVEAVIVVTGPGSYTGLRAGMAAGLGLAHARALPLHGVGSLEVVATVGAPGSAMAVADAGRGGLYVSPFGPGVMAATSRRIHRDELKGGLALVSLDRLDLAGLRRGDPAVALAASIPLGLSRAPLVLAGLTATYVEDPGIAPPGPRVSSA